MGLTKILLLAAMAVTGLLLLPSCQRMPPPSGSALETNQLQTVEKPVTQATNKVVAILHVQGSLALTNRRNTCLQLGAGKECIVTPRVLDGGKVQLTLAVETKSPAGKIIDLTMAQIVTRDGQPLKIAVGGYNLSLTPQVALE